MTAAVVLPVCELALEVQRATEETPADDEDIRSAAAAALAGRRSHAALCVRIVGSKESAALNNRYRGRGGPTNVLSFPCDADLPGQPLLGDLVVCAPVVIREAVEQGKCLRNHCQHLVVHGVLHLLGFDHEEQGQAERMEAAEREILARLGIADPYRDEVASPP